MYAQTDILCRKFLCLSKSFSLFNGKQNLLFQLVITVIGWKIQAIEAGGNRQSWILNIVCALCSTWNQSQWSFPLSLVSAMLCCKQLWGSILSVGWHGSVAPNTLYMVNVHTRYEPVGVMTHFLLSQCWTAGGHCSLQIMENSYANSWSITKSYTGLVLPDLSHSPMSSAKPPIGRRQVPITNCSKRTLFSLSKSWSNCDRQRETHNVILICQPHTDLPTSLTLPFWHICAKKKSAVTLWVKVCTVILA